MGLFDIFKRKKEELNEEVKQDIENVKEAINEFNDKDVSISGKRYVEKECEICKVVIGEDRYTKKSGYWFHNKCFRKKEQEIKNGGF